VTKPLKSLQRDELETVAELCARAFIDEPHIAYFFPEVSRRMSDSIALFRMRIDYGLRYGIVSATSNAESIAVWLPSEVAAMTRWRQLRAGGLRLYRQVGAEAVDRMGRVSEHNEALRLRTVPDEHIFLSLLAVDPSHQREGHASTLLRPMLDRCDRRMPVYAETTQPDVLSFYERLGFEAGEPSALPETDLRVWPLVRTY